MYEFYELIHQQPWFLYLCAGLVGAVFGSFLNAAIYRLPRNISMLRRTRSFCPSCEHDLAWYDNLPVLSYLALLGKCHYCRKPIGIRYLLVELVTVGVTELVAYHCLLLNPAQLGLPGFFLLLTLGLGAILLIATDFESFLIPDEASVIPLFVALGLAWFVPDQHRLSDGWVLAQQAASARQWNAVFDSLQGAMLAAATLYVLGALGTWWKRKPAMGDGDVLWMAAVGATVGWKLGILTIFLAAFVGIVMFVAMTIWLKMRKRTGETPRFELPGGEAPPPPWYSRWMNLFGALPAGIALMVINGLWLWIGQESPTQRMHNPGLLFAPTIGLAFGAVMVAYHFVRAHHIAKGTWIQVEIVTEADGKQFEQYDAGEAYLAFGPALAISGLVMAIWGPWLLSLFEIYVLRLQNQDLPRLLKVPFAG